MMAQGSRVAGLGFGVSQDRGCAWESHGFIGMRWADLKPYLGPKFR